MPVTLRRATQTAGDADALAWGLGEAGDGLFRIMFGSRWFRILAAAVREPGHELSLEHTTLAVEGEAVVGVLHGLHRRDMADPDAALQRAAGLHRMLRAALVEAAGRPLFRALDAHDSGDWYLQAIAVRPPRRGAGIGSALLDAAFDRARSSGAARTTLDVDVANTRARQLYERHGFAVVATSRPALLLGGERVHRMAREL